MKIKTEITKIEKYPEGYRILIVDEDFPLSFYIYIGDKPKFKTGEKVIISICPQT